jgi:hypothetical protein
MAAAGGEFGAAAPVLSPPSTFTALLMSEGVELAVGVGVGEGVGVDVSDDVGGDVAEGGSVGTILTVGGGMVAARLPTIVCVVSSLPLAGGAKAAFSVADGEGCAGGVVAGGWCAASCVGKRASSGAGVSRPVMRRKIPGATDAAMIASSNNSVTISVPANITVCREKVMVGAVIDLGRGCGTAIAGGCMAATLGAAGNGSNTVGMSRRAVIGWPYANAWAKAEAVR